MSITIKDIAKKASVSISTVSLVINNRGYVSQETRERVLEAMKELNYRPLHSARKLATQMTGNIGFILWEGHFSEVEMFYSQVFLGMEFAAREGDYYILLTTVSEQFDPKIDLPRFLKYRDVDGVALVGRVPHSLVSYLDKQKIPFVVVDYGLSGRFFNSIMIDNYNGAYMAVDHLIKTGRKKIGFVAGTFFHPSIKERYRGYQSALESYGLLNDDIIKKYVYLEETETSRKIGAKGAAELLSKDVLPDAIFCCNDTTALGVITEIQRRNLSIPQDIAIVGFDDIPPAEFNVPKLSTIRVPKLLLGKEAFRLLIDVINQPDLPPQTRIISVEFVERESC
jgi:LacI family transcriptional regulator